jgi:hypothetical protein
MTTNNTKDNEKTAGDSRLDSLVSCECGWSGSKSDLVHNSDCGEGWWCDQLECPNCSAVIVDSYGNEATNVLK